MLRTGRNPRTERRPSIPTTGVDDLATTRDFHVGIYVEKFGRMPVADNKRTGYFEPHGTLLGFFEKEASSQDAQADPFVVGPKPPSLAHIVETEEEAEGVLSLLESKGV